MAQLRDAPILPVECYYIWNIYLAASAGTETLTYRDIDSYQNVSGIRLTQWETQKLLEIDKIRIKHNGRDS